VGAVKLQLVDLSARAMAECRRRHVLNSEEIVKIGFVSRRNLTYINASPYVSSGYIMLNLASFGSFVGEDPTWRSSAVIPKAPVSVTSGPDCRYHTRGDEMVYNFVE
jgi:hypothetical protein